MITIVLECFDNFNMVHFGQIAFLNHLYFFLKKRFLFQGRFSSFFLNIFAFMNFESYCFELYLEL